MICGTVGRYRQHLAYIRDIIGLGNGVKQLTAMSAARAGLRHAVMADTYVQDDPSAEELPRSCVCARRRCAGSASSRRSRCCRTRTSASHDTPSARKMRAALDLIHRTLPELEVEGEMHADTRSPRNCARHASAVAARRQGEPPRDAESGRGEHRLQPAQQMGEGIAIGPILVGAARSAHVVTPSITVRGLLNMTGLAAVRAG